MNTKDELVGNIKKLLMAEDMDFGFLNKLEERKLKTLIASIRHRLEKQKQEVRT